MGKSMKSSTAKVNQSIKGSKSKAHRSNRPQRELITPSQEWQLGAQDIASFVEERVLISPIQINNDFQAHKPPQTNAQECCAQLLDKENIFKNRYRDHPCIDATRVKIDDHFLGDFINANWVDSFAERRAYILTQAPMPCTIHDFWRMVWHEEVKVIVNVTRLKEDGISKCAPYWPQILSEVHRHGDFYVMQMARNECINYDHTELWLGYDSQGKGEVPKRNVHLLHVHGWPDNCVPTEANLIPKIASKMHELNRNLMGEEDCPIVVHCSSGIGRSAVIVLYDILKQQIMLTHKINILESLNALRRCRPKSIWQDEHNLSLHLGLMYYVVHDRPNAQGEKNLKHPPMGR